jgi:hypothetical protein
MPPTVSEIHWNTHADSARPMGKSDVNSRSTSDSRKDATIAAEHSREARG